jgi:hypothetical protein
MQKNLTYLHKKDTQHTGNETELPQDDKAVFEKTSNLIINEDRLKTGQDQT